jgi:hypothetical protein
VAYGKLKTEHAGAKNGGGGWGHREDVKLYSRKRRRAVDRQESAREERAMKIVSASVGPFPVSPFSGELPAVRVTFEDGTEKELFRFYPDELSFVPAEFIGLTEKEARQLFVKKDTAYLRS